MRVLRVTAVLALCACGRLGIDTKDACVPESDMELCVAASACESYTRIDRCGISRSVDCGGCSAGLGCVAGTCKTPLCNPTSTYTTAPIGGMARGGVEDSIGGATPDGQVILYVQTVAGQCGAFHLVVADETAPGSQAYTQRDVYNTFVTLGLYNGQDAYAITADGLTIITTSANRKVLQATTRSAINMVDFGAPSTTDFDRINPQTAGNNLIFISPTLSADGLEFWYSLLDTGTGQFRGVFYSVRTSTTVAFPAPIEATPPVASYAIVQGISSDRLALFMFDNFTGRIFTRTSTSQPFSNPNDPALPPQIPGWQHKPLADCSRIVAMSSPGGCQNEDVVLLTRQ